jgi:hypothetical protein
MIEVIKDISSILSGVMVIIAFLGLVLKPTRQKVKKWIQEIVSQDTAEKIDELSKETFNKFDDLSKETTKKFDDLSLKLDQQNIKIDGLDNKSSVADQKILNHMQEIDARLNKLDTRVLENERDRIKAELSEYASKCARGMKIYPEEKLHIDEIYSKYTNQLHCNSTGSEFYHEIVKYYEHQDWLKS